jgi:hypothetical protein
MMKKGGQWIKAAIKKPGALTKQAKAAGMSVPAFREQVLANKEDYSGTTVRRANLAKTLSKMKKGKGGMEFKNPMGPDQMMEETEMTTVNPTMAEMDVDVDIEALDPNLDFARKDIMSLEKQAEKDNVRSYQRMLNQKYGAGLSEDGAWGPKTQAAYEKFIMGKPKAKPASQEPNPMTKNPERDLPNFERIDQVNIRDPRRVTPVTTKLQPSVQSISPRYMPSPNYPTSNSNPIGRTSGLTNEDFRKFGRPTVTPKMQEARESLAQRAANRGPNMMGNRYSFGIPSAVTKSLKDFAKTTIYGTPQSPNLKVVIDKNGKRKYIPVK